MVLPFRSSFIFILQFFSYLRYLMDKSFWCFIMYANWYSSDAFYQVKEHVAQAQKAQKTWAKSSFWQRRQVLLVFTSRAHMRNIFRGHWEDNGWYFSESNSDYLLEDQLASGWGWEVVKSCIQMYSEIDDAQESKSWILSPWSDQSSCFLELSIS